MPKSKEFISSTHAQRLKRIKVLADWVRVQKPKILSWLNRECRTLEPSREYGFLEYAPKFWFRDKTGVNHHVYFSELPKKSKEIILGRYVRKALRFRLAYTWAFCEATVKSYIAAVMREVGCEFKRSRWRCPI
mgnify:CR=1 FL=1